MGSWDFRDGVPLFFSDLGHFSSDLGWFPMFYSGTTAHKTGGRLLRGAVCEAPPPHFGGTC